jgi:myosin regulatory light chain 12
MRQPSAGITPTKQMLDALLSDRPGSGNRSVSGADGDKGINFTMFLTMMGEHLFEFDTEAELLEAFECFDEHDTGTVKCDDIRKWLGEVGERMDQEEV